MDGPCKRKCVDEEKCKECSWKKKVSNQVANVPQKIQVWIHSDTNKRFYSIRRLGEGSFGEVVLVGDDDGLFYALKVVDKRNPNYKVSRVYDEVVAGFLTDHQNVLKILDHWEDGTRHFILMEYVEGSSLLEQAALGRYCVPTKAHEVFVQMCQGLSHLHSKGIFHRDLKLENIVVDKQGRTKIVDFGLCKIEPDAEAKETLSLDWCGSLGYAAPEVKMHMPYLASKSDIWSLGVVLYTMLFLAFPKCTIPNECIDFTKDDKFNNFSSLKLLDLVQRMLTPDPSQRITLQEILEHPWVVNTTNNQ